MTEASQFAGGARIDIRPTTSDDCKPVFDKVDQWQKDLIDLSRRNTALYLTDKRAEKQVEITSPSLQELFDRLVQRGVSLDFPMPIYEQPTSLNSTSERKDKPQESIRKGDLETNLPVAELQLRLRRLRRDRLTSQEEQGIHTLFLAVAFLRWKEKSQFGGEEDEYLAPIILVPVELDRKSVDDPYFIRLSEEDIVANPALIFKLKTDFGIALPELPEELDKESVIGYLEEVEDATKNRGWQVMRNVRLGRFTYEKFVMYNDLTDHKQDACLHPIIRALAKTSSIPDDDFQVPDNLDDGVNPCELFPILDADSSQMEALLRFHRGQNLVIQGPPGTGKSQTIANLISQGLRDGKKILFVSEKMAALEVVLRRLQSAELSFACLEVHSHKSDKLKVVKELANTLEQSQYEEVAPDADQQYQRLIKLRDRLNEYAKELHKTRGGQKLSAFDVHGRLAKILNAPAVEFRLPVDSVVQMTSDQLDEFVSAIHKIKDIEGVFDNLDRHPWRGVEFMATDVSGLALDPSMLVDNLMSTLKSLKDDVSKLQEEASSIVTGLGIEKPATVAEMDGLIKAVELLSKPQVILGQWTTLSTKELGTLISQTRELRELHRQLEENKTKLTRIFRLDLLQLPVGLMLSRFESQYRTPLRFLKTDYRHDMSLLLSHSSSTRRIRYEEARKSLALAKEIIALQNRIDSLKVALGQFYQEVETAWDQDIGGLEWLSQILRELGRSDFPPKLRELVQHPDQLTPLCEGALARLKPLSSEINKGIHKIETVMKSYSIDGGTLANAPFPKLESWLDEKRNRADLQNWLSYQRAKQNCQKLGLDPFLDAAKKEGTSAKDLEIAFMRRIWKAWLAEAYRESPVLQDFVATSHERIIQEFSYVDERVKLVTAKIVRQKIAKSQPKAEAGTVAESQMGIILREAKKKRRVMPLRKLFATTPQLIQDLKPCMLMSPLSVASYLGTSPYHFDWVIFDEASQIPPADAIGAILRGTHLIVVGDDKQLPPTTFFQAGLDFNEESEEGPEEPLESILDECLTIPRFKKVFLKWHYRSKREELIDFSNKHFYNGKLVTFPSPDLGDSSFAVELHLVKDGVYDRGGSRTNVQEARAVCNLIEEHFRQHGSGLSLGVITLGIAQEEAIWDEFENRKTKNPDLATQSVSNENEPLFIKSLEKVQGDERDCIIISIGYGKDANGAFSLNFGPINKAGGERRLNVAITRAREKVTIVSSIDPEQFEGIRLSTKSRGVLMLVNYLEYAYNKGKSPAQTSGIGEPESDFEIDVRDQLVDRGFKVDAQVGCSGFRIDLAIRNPQNPNRYILGIECDGATYHRHRSARDRDKQRQAVLESKGWKIYRVWSTEWVKNRDKIVNSIAAKVAELVANGPNMAGVRVSDGDPTKGVKNVQPNEINEGDVEKRSSQSQFLHEGSQYGFKPYVEYSSQDKVKRDVQHYLQEIVQKETPIHINALVHRVAAVYGMKKVGSSERRCIMSHIQRAKFNGIFRIVEDFCWIGDSVIPRIPQPGTEPRPIQEIALEELMAAAKAIVEKHRGMPRGSLVREVGRVFGFKRKGKRIDLRVERAIDQLYKQGVFSTYGNQVVLSENGS